MTLQRHQLFALRPEAWAELLGADGPTEEHDCLRFWAEHDLPLVVTRQAHRGVMAAAADAPVAGVDVPVALGLPAPLRWNRRKLSLLVRRDALAAERQFPLLRAVVPRLPGEASGAGEALLALAEQLGGLGLVPRVHGSHGWQLLCGLPCARPGSDLDLLVPVQTCPQADAAAAYLAQCATAPLRLDGELLLPDGGAVAWREWLQWRQGAVQLVMVKRLHGPVLATGTEWLHASGLQLDLERAG